MKLVMFNDFVPGVLDGNRVVDISSAVSDIPHMSPQELMSDIIAEFDSLERRASKTWSPRLTASTAQTSASGRRFPSPRRSSPWPPTIWSMERERRPALINAFLKSSNSIIGDGDTLVLPDAPAAIFHPRG